MSRRSQKWWKKPFYHLLTLVGLQTTILLNKHCTQHRKCRTNLSSILKEIIVALFDKDVSYDPLPMERLRGRHFLSACPSTEASDSRGKKAQSQLELARIGFIHWSHINFQCCT
ncbi:hypothetical protein ElyMa_004247900 [Elysia marginata]|uniref:PiggyBac transposable element-derived protein domain-containing protein n=1 Tax=Elysia marginata TaxID=1093978 RepID=A0AAV4GVA9_9GAST|nr:hypothetical protein ElyMa_004247900 [Elysia marginata]